MHIISIHSPGIVHGQSEQNEKKQLSIPKILKARSHALTTYTIIE